jgi:hypothetical protein
MQRRFWTLSHYEGVLRSLKHGTVQGYLTGIRHYHVDAGLGDVTKHPKITATMKGGLKKASGVSIHQKRPGYPTDAYVYTREVARL